METAKTITECLHSYGIHSITLQPELKQVNASDREIINASSDVIRRRVNALECNTGCGVVCEDMTCCD